jgi:hypothetical protein
MLLLNYCAEKATEQASTNKKSYHFRKELINTTEPITPKS